MGRVTIAAADELHLGRACVQETDVVAATVGGQAPTFPPSNWRVYRQWRMRYEPHGVMERYHVGFAAGALAGLALGIPAGHALLRDRGEPRSVVAARAQTLLPNDPSRGGVATLVDEGRQAHRNGQPERALALARDAERLEPGNPNIKNNICAYLGELRRFDDAVSACQAAVKLQPDFQLARNNLAWVQAERDKAGASSRRP